MGGKFAWAALFVLFAGSLDAQRVRSRGRLGGGINPVTPGAGLAVPRGFFGQRSGRGGTAPPVPPGPVLPDGGSGQELTIALEAARIALGNVQSGISLSPEVNQAVADIRASLAQQNVQLSTEVIIATIATSINAALSGVGAPAPPVVRTSVEFCVDPIRSGVQRRRFRFFCLRLNVFFVGVSPPSPPPPVIPPPPVAPPPVAPPLVAPPPAEPLPSLEELNANRQRWRGISLQDYVMTISLPPDRSFRVGASQSGISFVQPDAPGISIVSSVEGVFTEVERVLNLQPRVARLRVTYDEQFGFISSLFIDFDASSPNDDLQAVYSFANPITPPSAFPTFQELQSNRERWRSSGISRYNLTISLRCFCVIPLQTRVLVGGGNVESIVAIESNGQERVLTPQELSSFFDGVFGTTVEAIFSSAEEAITRRLRFPVLEVQYDETFGFISRFNRVSTTLFSDSDVLAEYQVQPLVII